MAFLVGVVLAFGFGLFGTFVGLDRERAFYTTIMIVIALLYGLFAAIGGSPQALLAESPHIVGFIAVAVYGFKRNLWLVAAALLAHGVMDFFHGDLIANPGVPLWWPAFCGSYDVVAAGYLGCLLRRRDNLVHPAATSAPAR